VVGGVVGLRVWRLAAGGPHLGGVVGVGEVGYRVPCGGAERSLWIGRRVA
jgi:hypothetical protein